MKEGPKPGPPPRRTAVAAVIERDGRVLICQRSRHDSHPLKWEFPGGKIENGESPAVCAARELREEMDVRIETGDVIAESEHDYGDKVVRLIAVRAILLDGHIRLHDHDEIRWVAIPEMADYLFAPADEAIVEKLVEEHSRRPHQKRS